MERMPAVSLVARPGKVAAAVELAKEVERAGFTGIYVPSFGDSISFCVSMAHATSTLEFGTSILPIYLRHASDLAGTSAYLHDLSGGRFRLGLGVTHGPVLRRLGVSAGKPLSDMRDYVGELRGSAGRAELAPVVLAALRSRMVQLSAEIADGAVWANASRSHMASSLADVPDERIQGGFFIGNMIPTVIDDDRDAAAAVNRRTLSGYVALPNYRNYWKAAGYEEEMTAIEQALQEDRRDDIPRYMTDAWLQDSTLYGSAAEVREGLEAWFDAGVSTPIVVPSSTSGGQFHALREVMDALSEAPR